MNELKLEEDITIVCIKAKSFPEGIHEAIEKAQSILPKKPNRSFFGISRPENGKIMYMAGSEISKSDTIDISSFDKFILKKGTYIFETIKDFRNNLPKIETTFQSLISKKDIDPHGYCIEWYFNDLDMKCMIRKKS